MEASLHFCYSVVVSVFSFMSVAGVAVVVVFCSLFVGWLLFVVCCLLLLAVGLLLFVVVGGGCCCWWC